MSSATTEFVLVSEVQPGTVVLDPRSGVRRTVESVASHDAPDHVTVRFADQTLLGISRQARLALAPFDLDQLHIDAIAVERGRRERLVIPRREIRVNDILDFELVTAVSNTDPLTGLAAADVRIRCGYDWTALYPASETVSVHRDTSITEAEWLDL